MLALRITIFARDDLLVEVLPGYSDPNLASVILLGVMRSWNQILLGFFP